MDSKILEEYNKGTPICEVAETFGVTVGYVVCLVYDTATAKT